MQSLNICMRHIVVHYLVRIDRQTQVFYLIQVFVHNNIYQFNLMSFYNHLSYRQFLCFCMPYIVVHYLAHIRHQSLVFYLIQVFVRNKRCFLFLWSFLYHLSYTIVQCFCMLCIVVHCLVHTGHQNQEFYQHQVSFRSIIHFDRLQSKYILNNLYTIQQAV